MAPYVDRIIQRLHEAEDDLTRETEEQQKRWHYRFERGRVWFGEEVRRAQRVFKQSLRAFIREASVASIVSAPIIYSLLIPFVVLDAWVTIYQRICSPIYGIERVPRHRYVLIDRHRLSYLNGIEKINCDYCGYANGVIAYVREVAARTEQYWCPIRHARAIPTPHSHYHLFFDYGDGKTYRHDLPKLRRALQPPRKRT
jgi:hypothetical protein